MILLGSELKPGTIIKGVRQHRKGHWTRFKPVIVSSFDKYIPCRLAYRDGDRNRLVLSHCLYKVVYR